MLDAAHLWPGRRSRAATFENPTASPSAGGTVAGGRKGAPSRVVASGERVVLADLEGPGVVTHVWLTVAGLDLSRTPVLLRSQILEVFHGDLALPSVSAPVPDLFGAVHGVAVPFASALTAVNEGRGFASRVPMPFPDAIRIEYQNTADRPVLLYYQADVLLGPLAPATGILHAAFRRENPTTLGRDFVITEGLRGPGRYLGCTGGVRVLDGAHWWGEGEVKVYFDGETTPTICGTGTEDYLDSAWGLGTFAAPESGAPIVVGTDDARHELVSFYRWHLSDPVVFERDVRVTVQQIGSAIFQEGEEGAYATLRERVTPAGHGWVDLPAPMAGFGLFERVDDWCATSFVYCAEAQGVPHVDVAAAVADLPDAVDEGRVVRRR